MVGRRDLRPILRPLTRIAGEAGGVWGGVGGSVSWDRSGVVATIKDRRGKMGRWRRVRFGRIANQRRRCRGWWRVAGWGWAVISLPRQWMRRGRSKGLRGGGRRFSGKVRKRSCVGERARGDGPLWRATNVWGGCGGLPTAFTCVATGRHRLDRGWNWAKTQ